MSERPGPDIGSPKQQHQVVAMLWLLLTAQDQGQALVIRAGLEWTARHLWGWEAERLGTELIAVQEALLAYQGRTTFWFTSEGMEYDYVCSPPP